jgi:hypothetical protein
MRVPSALHRRPLHLLAILTLALAAILSSGCAAPQMKGTPFYSGEYEKREGPPEDRVNVWPLFYHRAPATSFLWPIGEKTDDHLAIRPLFAIYGLDNEEGKREYSVLWPLSEFDFRTHWYHILLAFWGSGPSGVDYRLVFPFYWHRGDPFDRDAKGDAWDSVFPLYIYRRTGAGGPGPGPAERSLHLLWPLIRFGLTNGRHRIFPYFWGTDSDDDRYRVLFPIFWQNGSPYTKGDGVVAIPPLYIDRRDASRRTLYAPWPFVKSVRQPDQTRFRAWPLFGGNWHEKGGGRWYALWPLLWRWSRPRSSGTGWFSPWWTKGEHAGHCAIPLYFFARSGEDHVLLSPIWSQERRGKDAWQLLLPLFFRSATEQRSTFLSLLWSNSRSRDNKSGWHAAIPFYYYQRDEDGWRFLSLPWARRRRDDGTGWALAPPLYTHHKSKERESWFTPLFAAGRTENTRWHAVVPLYFRRQAKNETLTATPLGGWRTDEAGRRWLIWPLLTSARRTDGGGWFWALAPLIHARWECSEKGAVRSHHVLPLYYYDGKSSTFVSLLAARWGEKGRFNTLIPPLLSWLNIDRRNPGSPRRDLWFLGGIGRACWGDGPNRGHLFPLYYHDGRKNLFLSPAYATWRAPRGPVRMLPALLSWHRRLALHGGYDFWGFGGIYRREKEILPPPGRDEPGAAGGNPVARGHLVPFYWYKDSRSGGLWGARRAFTPLFGWDRGRKGYRYYATPLIGQFRSEPIEPGVPLSRRGFWVWPLVSWKRTPKRTSTWVLWSQHVAERDGRVASHFFPFYSYDRRQTPRKAPAEGAMPTPWSRRTSLRILLLGWHRRRERGEPDVDGTAARDVAVSHGVFPFWWHSSERRTNPRGATQQLESRTRIFFLGSGGRRERRWEQDGQSFEFVEGRSGLFPFWWQNRSRTGVAGKPPASVDDNARYGLLAWRKRTKRRVPGPDGTLETDRTQTSNGLFPLWMSWSTTDRVARTVRQRRRFLVALWDSLREAGPDPDDPKTRHDYTRKRLLWRVWHYEKVDGDVAVDLFPFTTWDRRRSGYRRFSFGGPLLRWEKHPDRGTGFRLLFIPFSRLAPEKVAGRGPAPSNPSPPKARR